MAHSAEPGGPAVRAAAIAVPDAGGGDGPARFELGPPARGPWRPDAAHGGAPAALLARAIEVHGAGNGMRLASFQSVFLGPVLLGAVELETEVLKPGRRQMVVAAKLTDGERTLIEARGVLLRTGDIELPPGAADQTGREEALPPPETLAAAGEGRWASDGETAFHKTSNMIRVVEGGPEQTRPDGAAWFRLDAPVVPGEQPSPAQRAVAAADFGNGLAHPVPFGDYVFVNCDLNVWLLREPRGEWIGVRSLTEVSPNGSGLTRTSLHDRQGRFGTAGQSLYVDVAG
jgi:acyl-coenzyme A thioesterase PaaI-like protein